MALYHTYRPQSFSDVIGQTHIVKILRQQVKEANVAHAYLFAGPRGVGKTTLARILAKAVNVPKADGSGEPDNDNPLAKEITEARSIDVIEIDAASHTGVDHVREHIIENAQFRPTTLPRKVFIIDEVHMLSTSAFNALLKTLEEPPAHAMFILATTELHKLPETIISRCQRFAFTGVPHEELKAYIKHVAKDKGVMIEDAVADRVVYKSDGCVRDAISLLDQLIAGSGKEITTASAEALLPTVSIEHTLGFTAALIGKDVAAALDALFIAVEQGVNIKQFSEDIIMILRAMIVSGVSNKPIPRAFDFSADSTEKMQTLLQHISPAELVQLADLVGERRAQIATSIVPTFPLELVAVEWCGKQKERTSKPSANVAAPIAKPVNVIEPKTPEVQPENTPRKINAKPVANEVAEKKIEPSTESPSVHVADIDAKTAKNAWHSMTNTLSKESPSLGFVLKSAMPKGYENGILQLVVQFAFHKDAILDHKNKMQIESTLRELVGGHMQLDITIDESFAPPQSSAEPGVTKLAAAFGGEVM